MMPEKQFSMGRRRALAALAIAGCGPWQAGAAQATEKPAGAWPAHPIRLVCPFGAGTSPDTLARLMARGLSEVLGENVVVETRVGASGNIASDIVARAPPDGYTLLLGTTTLSILPATIGARAVDPEQALAPVSLLVTQPLIIAAHPSFPGTTFADIVRMAKERPDTIAYSTSGIGGGGHLAAEWASSRTGIRLVHVPYTASRALIDVQSGMVPLAFSYPGTVVPLLRSGQLKGIAVTSLKRLDVASDVPTMAESGLPGFEVMNWQGILAPPGVPPDIMDRLHSALVRVLAAPDVRERLRSLGVEPVGSTPGQFAQTIRQDTQRWKDVVAKAGLRFE